LISYYYLSKFLKKNFIASSSTALSLLDIFFNLFRIKIAFILLILDNLSILI
jgi:hypothetical protein